MAQTLPLHPLDQTFEGIRFCCPKLRGLCSLSPKPSKMDAHQGNVCGTALHGTELPFTSARPWGSHWGGPHQTPALLRPSPGCKLGVTSRNTEKTAHS